MYIILLKISIKQYRKKKKKLLYVFPTHSNSHLIKYHSLGQGLASNYDAFPTPLLSALHMRGSLDCIIHNIESHSFGGPTWHAISEKNIYGSN